MWLFDFDSLDGFSASGFVLASAAFNSEPTKKLDGTNHTHTKNRRNRRNVQLFRPCLLPAVARPHSLGRRRPTHLASLCPAMTLTVHAAAGRPRRHRPFSFAFLSVTLRKQGAPRKNGVEPLPPGVFLPKNTRQHRRR